MEEKENIEFIYDDYKADPCGDIDDFIFAPSQEFFNICEK